MQPLLLKATRKTLLNKTTEALNSGKSWTDILSDEEIDELISALNLIIGYLHKADVNPETDENFTMFLNWVEIFNKSPDFLFALSQDATSDNSNKTLLNISSLILLFFARDELCAIGCKLLSALPKGTLNLYLERFEQEFKSLDITSIDLLIALFEHLFALGETGKNCAISLFNKCRLISDFFNENREIPSHWPTDIITCKDIFYTLDEKEEYITVSPGQNREVDFEDNITSTQHFHDFLSNIISKHEAENPLTEQLKALKERLARLQHAPHSDERDVAATYASKKVFRGTTFSARKSDAEDSQDDNNNNNVYITESESSSLSNVYITEPESSSSSDDESSDSEEENETQYIPIAQNYSKK